MVYPGITILGEREVYIATYVTYGYTGLNLIYCICHNHYVGTAVFLN